MKAGEALRAALAAANVDLTDVAAYMHGTEVTREEAEHWLQLERFDKSLRRRLAKSLKRLGVDSQFLDADETPEVPAEAPPEPPPETAPKAPRKGPPKKPSTLWAWCGDPRHHWPHNLKVNTGASCRTPKSQWIVLDGYNVEHARIHLRQLKARKPK